MLHKVLNFLIVWFYQFSKIKLSVKNSVAVLRLFFFVFLQFLLNVLLQNDLHVLTLSGSSEFRTDSEDESNMERTCDSLLMCIVTVLSHGLRSGGGVGDVLRKPSKEVNSSLDWLQAMRECLCVLGECGICCCSKGNVSWLWAHCALNLFLFQKCGAFAMFPNSCTASGLC